MASIRDRVGRLETEHAPPAGPGPSEDYDEYVRMMNRDRAAIDAADRAALDPSERADLTFGDGPETEPLVEAANEPERTGGDFYFDMLLELRAEIPDSHPKAGILDTAIAAERKTTATERTQR